MLSCLSSEREETIEVVYPSIQKKPVMYLNPICFQSVTNFSLVSPRVSSSAMSMRVSRCVYEMCGERGGLVESVCKFQNSAGVVGHTKGRGAEWGGSSVGGKRSRVASHCNTL